MSSVRGAGQPVIVGVDGSKPALDAVRWAAREAELRGATLRLVHAFGWMRVADPDDYPELELAYRKALLKDAQEWLADAARLVLPSVEVVTEVLDDFPIPRLVTESRNAQLVVIGDRGLGGIGGLLVGSVAVALVVHAECPVVVVRTREPGGAPVADGPVVVGIDGSPVSEDALAFAFDAAAARHVPLVAVHTYKMTFFEPVGALMVDWGSIATDEGEVLAERMAGWTERYPDVDVQRVVVPGRASAELVRRSETAQLMVVGSHGRGGLAGLFLGSVSHAVLHRARCPLAIVRPRKSRDRGGGR
jgi:nucleotide-binding universal stress UspA family protein